LRIPNETQVEKVVYQALYGDVQMWVRPKEMFFGKVERDGKLMGRFEEVGLMRFPWIPEPELTKTPLDAPKCQIPILAMRGICHFGP
jgi:hypothetical protein